MNSFLFFFFNDTATTEIYTLSLHDALPISSHTCGIATGGLAYCWGDNTAGELGTGDGRSHRRPAAVTGHLAFVSLSAGDGFTCGITDAGLAYCWCRNTYGQLGSFAPLRAEVPIPVV